MTAAKHTPGPWKVIQAYNQMTFDDSTIASIKYCDDHGNRCDLFITAEADCLSVMQERENAQLIAAAPELLESLKECVCQISAMQAIGKQTEADGTTWLEKARYAVAKATGAA